MLANTVARYSRRLVLTMMAEEQIGNGHHVPRLTVITLLRTLGLSERFVLPARLLAGLKRAPCEIYLRARLLLPASLLRQQLYSAPIGGIATRGVVGKLLRGLR